MTKNILTGIVVAAAALGVLAFFGLTPYGKTVIQQVAGSAVGTTFSTQKYYAINMSLTAGTSTSILNTDSSDRIVTLLQLGCESVGASVTAYTGATLNQLTLKVATTSASCVGSTPTATCNVTNTNYVANTFIATSSVNASIASSTALSILGGMQINQVWPTGTYLTFSTNATNTAQCIIGVQAIGT